MNQPGASGNNHQIAKRRIFNNEGDKQDAAAVNIKQTGEIFKLDIDCLEGAFEYLRVKDLISISQTCKRLQQVAGYCFQQNYLGRATCMDDSGIFNSACYYPKIPKSLLPFIQEIEIHQDGFQKFFDARLELRRLKEIHIYALEKVAVSHLKEISLTKLEVLRIYDCHLGNNFHEILDQCVNLKHLEIPREEGVYNWFGRYPTLEYLKWEPYSLKSIVGITMFLGHNPNIRKFATNSLFFWKCCNRMVETNIKLDDLAINMDTDIQNIDELNSMCGLLNKLHELGLYKKLQLYFHYIPNQEMINQLANVNGLSKIFVFNSDAPLTFSVFTNLEELYVHRSRNVVDLQILPNKLINLKRIEIFDINFDDVIPFITRSVELQGIKLGIIRSGVHFNHTLIINLVALNRDRGQLIDAAKVTLYVDESVYLATKWALGETDFQFIRLKRNKSYEWHHDFIFDL